MQTDVRTYVFNINNNIMIPTKTVEFSVLDEVRGYLITQSNHVKSKTLTQETKKQNRNELNLLAQMRGCVILLSSYISSKTIIKETKKPTRDGFRTKSSPDRILRRSVGFSSVFTTFIFHGKP